MEQLTMDLGEAGQRWKFAPWREIISAARRQGWTGTQTTSTFRSRRHGWWCDSSSRLGELPTGSAVVGWLTRELGAGRNPGLRAAEEIRPPSYAEPAFYAGVYLDVKSAYWSIYRHLTWDCEYLPGGFFAQGNQHLGDFPHFQNKLARNCLVGVAASSQFIKWEGGRARIIRRKGGLWNPNLTGFIWSVLGAVAWRCHDAGARYWNLDGAIVPYQQTESVKLWAAEHGLTLRPKSGLGMAHIKSVGSYSMPGARTKNFTHARNHSSFSLPPREACNHAIQVFARLALS